MTAVTAALDQVRAWFQLVDAGYQDPNHPIMAGSPDCPTCVAEGNLNRLFSPRLGLKLAEELTNQWKDNHGEHCKNEPFHAGKCYWPLPSALTSFAEQVEAAVRG